MIVSATQALAVAERIETLAADVGRLRRRLPQEVDYTLHLVDRIGRSIDSLDAFLWPSAAELVEAGVDVNVALRHVEKRAERMRTLLGEEKR
jgi:hypothetical protein